MSIQHDEMALGRLVVLPYSQWARSRRCVFVPDLSDLSEPPAQTPRLVRIFYAGKAAL
jgi:hypothetical protein